MGNLGFQAIYHLLNARARARLRTGLSAPPRRSGRNTAAPAPPSSASSPSGPSRILPRWPSPSPLRPTTPTCSATPGRGRHSPKSCGSRPRRPPGPGRRAWPPSSTPSPWPPSWTPSFWGKARPGRSPSSSFWPRPPRPRTGPACSGTWPAPSPAPTCPPVTRPATTPTAPWRPLRPPRVSRSGSSPPICRNWPPTLPTATSWPPRASGARCSWWRPAGAAPGAAASAPPALSTARPGSAGPWRLLDPGWPGPVQASARSAWWAPR